MIGRLKDNVNGECLKVKNVPNIHTVSELY